MGWNGFGMGWGMWLPVLAGVIGVWVLVAYVVRGMTRDRVASAPEPETPLAVLDRRLASGEITIEDYQRLRRTLTGGH